MPTESSLKKTITREVLERTPKGFIVSGVFPTVAFDFHHEDPSEKEGHPSWFLNKSGERWKEELAKCVLLCANCHRIRHFGGGYSYDRSH